MILYILSATQLEKDGLMTNIDPQLDHAFTLLGMALGHAEKGFGDTARRVLASARPQLMYSRIGRLRYATTAAYIEAREGNYGTAIDFLQDIRNMLSTDGRLIPPQVYTWVSTTCYAAMDRLPHTHQLKTLIERIYRLRSHGDYSGALELLAVLDSRIKPVAHLIPPHVHTAHTNAWIATLEAIQTHCKQLPRNLLRGLAAHVASESNAAK